ncbi:MAG: hypothetical protein BWY43_00050 [candidate division WS2 bacterium ADurb.Bin280]|uniref:Uncharacterized protein n=1 Tax=candidate division WS2 bacterium ADurb.Bin280 TaxID=1852829 RepID=A0A1V5SFF3_9BACT|nr:MAG: hypothetical protein BWY43_00050 [candidate division WS2 bacterium ADurb.Bin280]
MKNKKNIIKNFQILTTVIVSTFAILANLLIVVPTTKADTAAQSGGDPSLDAAVTDSGSDDSSDEEKQDTAKSKDVTLLVTVTSSQNQRYLGGVKLTFKSEKSTSKFSPLYKSNDLTTTDPPPPGGFKIEKFLSGKYELIAQRKGYKIYDEIVEISGELTTAEIEVELEPLPGTPVVEEGDIDDYRDTLEDYYRDMYSGNFSSNSYYNNPYATNMFSSQNNSNIYNPYSQYPQFGLASNYPNSYQNQYIDPYSPQNQGLINQPINQYGQPGPGLSGSSIQNTNYFDSSSYSVQVNASGQVYLVNGLNRLDNRQLYFVDRGDGRGGVAFIRDYSSNVSSAYGNWFISLYSRSQNGQITINPSVFTRTIITPDQFASANSKNVVEQFRN